jgi:phosphoglycolate phosphatase
MMRQYQLIVFDWDGTLMDSADKIVKCFSAAAADVGITYPGEDTIRHVIGLGLREAMNILAPHEPVEIQNALIERYRDHFLVHDKTAMPLFEGVEQGLLHLRQAGYRMAIATGKARRGLERVLNETGLGDLFDATRCADEAGSKPHPRMLNDLLAHTGIESKRAIMVGDTTYDLEMAKNASMPALAVTYGVHSKEHLLAHQPLACLSNFNEVCQWLS